MDELDSMYNDLIMEHSMCSCNKKNLKKCDFCEFGHNPNCGDEIKLELKLNGNIIEDMAFTRTWLCNITGFYFHYDRYFKRKNNRGGKRNY